MLQRRAHVSLPGSGRQPVKLILSKPMELTSKDTQVAVLEEDPDEQQSYHHSCCEMSGRRHPPIPEVESPGDYPLWVMISLDQDVWLLLMKCTFFSSDNQNLVHVWPPETLRNNCKQDDIGITILTAPRVIFR